MALTQTIATLALALTGDASGAMSAFRLAAKEGRKFEKAMASISYVGKKLETVGKGLTIGVTLPLALGAKAAAELGMAALDAQDLVGKAFGGMATEADLWAKTFSRTMGLNRFDVLTQVGNLQLLGRNMGLTATQSFTMAKGLEETSLNLAAMLDKDPTETYEAMRKGMAGAYRGLKDLNIVVDAAMVKQYAYSHGIAKQGKALTAAQEAMAAYRLIMEQASTSQGAWAEELKTPEGRLRAMKDSFRELGATVGIIILPTFAKLADWARSLATWFDGLSEGSKRFAVGLLAVAAVVGPLILVLSTFAKGIVVIGAAMRIINVLAVAFPLSRIGLAAAGAFPSLNSLSASMAIYTDTAAGSTIASANAAKGITGIGTAATTAKASLGWLLLGFGALFAAWDLLKRKGEAGYGTFYLAMERAGYGAGWVAKKKAMADEAATEQAYYLERHKEQLRSDLANLPAPDGGGPGGGGTFDFLSEFKDRLSILDRQYQLWQATFRGSETSYAAVARQSEFLAAKLGTLNEAIAALSATQGKDAEETRKVTLELLDLQIQAEETKKAMDALKPKSDQSMLNWLAYAAGKAGEAGKTLQERWGANAPLTGEEIRDAIRGSSGVQFLTPTGLAGGGRTTLPGVFTVGERGPENVFLPAGAAVTPSSSMSNRPISIAIHFNGTVYRPEDIIREFDRYVANVLPRRIRDERLSTV